MEELLPEPIWKQLQALIIEGDHKDGLVEFAVKQEVSKEGIFEIKIQFDLVDDINHFNSLFTRVQSSFAVNSKETMTKIMAQAKCCLHKSTMPNATNRLDTENEVVKIAKKDNGELTLTIDFAKLKLQLQDTYGIGDLPPVIVPQAGEYILSWNAFCDYFGRVYHPPVIAEKTDDGIVPIAIGMKEDDEAAAKASDEKLTVQLVVDVSESLSDYIAAYKVQLQNLAKELFENYQDNMSVNLVSFSYGVNALGSFGNEEDLVAAISELCTQGATNLHGALHDAYAQIATVEGKKAIILVTDGRDNEKRKLASEVVVKAGEVEAKCSSDLQAITLEVGDFRSNGVIEDLVQKTGMKTTKVNGISDMQTLLEIIPGLGSSSQIYKFLQGAEQKWLAKVAAGQIQVSSKAIPDDAVMKHGNQDYAMQTENLVSADDVKIFIASEEFGNMVAFLGMESFLNDMSS